LALGFVGRTGFVHPEYVRQQSTSASNLLVLQKRDSVEVKEDNDDDSTEDETRKRWRRFCPIDHSFQLELEQTWL